MISVSVKADFAKAEKLLLAAASNLQSRTIPLALTRTAAVARRDVMEAMPTIFDRPVPFTVRSIRYEPATAINMRAAVFISDHSAKGGLSPRRYLGPEISGGARSRKSSEKMLSRGGLIDPDQWVMPGAAAKLDRYGNISGSAMVQILSRIKAFGEMGYTANVTARSRGKLKAVKDKGGGSGTDMFIGREKYDHRARAVFLKTGGRTVRPLLWFANRAPSYRPRFPFQELVEKSVRKNWSAQMMRSLNETILAYSRGRK